MPDNNKERETGKIGIQHLEWNNRGETTTPEYSSGHCVSFVELWHSSSEVLYLDYS